MASRQKKPDTCRAAILAILSLSCGCVNRGCESIPAVSDRLAAVPEAGLPDFLADRQGVADGKFNLLFMHHSSGEGWLHYSSSDDPATNDSLVATLMRKRYIHDINEINYVTGVQPDEGRPTSLLNIPGSQMWVHNWIYWFNDYLLHLKTFRCRNHLNRIIMFYSDYRIDFIEEDSPASQPPSPFSEQLMLKHYMAVFRHPEGPGRVYRHPQNDADYRALEDVFAANPDTLFIFLTNPPLHYSPEDPVLTIDDTTARRNRTFADWLKGTWLKGYDARNPGLHNVAVFDWFDLLAFPDDHPLHPNRLRVEFGGESGDSHPNSEALLASTRAFASGTDSFLDRAVNAYGSRPSAVIPPGDPPAGAGPELVWRTIKAGRFTLGAAESDRCSTSMFMGQQETQRQIDLSHDFEISTTELTQGRFNTLMGYNPSYHSRCGPNCPVEYLTWHEAAAFCNALSESRGLTPCYSCMLMLPEKEGSFFCSVAAAYDDAYSPGENYKESAKIYSCPGYRLPTDAEWEYAYRAGTTTGYYSGESPSTEDACYAENATLDPIGWYWDNGGNTTHPVGQRAPNGWGLYDMAGNVSEFCHDRYPVIQESTAITDPVGPGSGYQRVLRGGSVFFYAGYCRASFRHPNISAENRCNQCGLRCVRTIDPT